MYFSLGSKFKGSQHKKITLSFQTLSNLQIYSLKQKIICYYKWQNNAGFRYSKLKTGPSILEFWDLRVIYQHLVTPECSSVIGGALWNHCVIRISVWISQALNYWSCQGDHLCMDCEGLLLKRVAPFPFLNSHAYCSNTLSLVWCHFEEQWPVD